MQGLHCDCSSTCTTAKQTAADAPEEAFWKCVASDLQVDFKWGFTKEFATWWQLCHANY